VKQLLCKSKTAEREEAALQHPLANKT